MKHRDYMVLMEMSIRYGLLSEYLKLATNEITFEEWAKTFKNRMEQQKADLERWIEIKNQEERMYSEKSNP